MEEVVEKFEMGLCNFLFRIFLIIVMIAATLNMQLVHVNAAQGLFLFETFTNIYIYKFVYVYKLKSTACTSIIYFLYL